MRSSKCQGKTNFEHESFSSLSVLNPSAKDLRLEGNFLPTGFFLVISTYLLSKVKTKDFGSPKALKLGQRLVLTFVLVLNDLELGPKGIKLFRFYADRRTEMF